MKSGRDFGSVGHSISATNSEEQSCWKPSQASQAYMSGNVSPHTPPRRLSLDAHDQARELVRLVQCPQCSLPLRVPVTLPCGHSLCRVCLPASHRREYISYPNTPDRLQGVRCPIEGCGQEHPEGDCSVDVCLSKIMETIQVVFQSCNQLPSTTETKLLVTGSNPMQEKPFEFVSVGGRLMATFVLAGLGKLDYRSEAQYEPLSEAAGDDRRMSELLLESLQDMTHKDLDCHVCYNMMYDPVTTSCGHTFCRKCLARVLDHSTHCPMCRRTLPIPPSLEFQKSNQRLVNLLLGLAPDLYATRADAVAAEEIAEMGELNTRLFVCTLAFPGMPTFLHIFEPRYRLMIRRALEGNRQFGMLMYNQVGAPQPELGMTNFKEYGTMLRILNVHILPDGRSLVETKGLYTFRVRAHGTVDGYTVGRVDRVEDVSLADEERLEAEDMSPSVLDAENPTERRNSATGTPNRLEDIHRLSTQQLLMAGLEFIQKMRAHSAPWLHQRIIEVHGGPPHDPALFPYWFASIIPIVDEEKYQLLRTTSVRDRLKIVVGWIRRIESQRWFTGGNCRIL